MSYDTKKIFSFLNKCTITEINEDKKTVVVTVANDFVLIQVRKFFLDGLRDSLHECYNQQYDIEIIVDSQITGVELKGVLESSGKSKKSDETEKAINKSAEQVFQTHKNTLSEYFGVLFDIKYQFENFVVGPNNEFANAILQAICENPGEAHNPFFLHGNVGLGKTHLLQATGNQIIKARHDKTVVYLPTSKLVTEIINSIKNNSVNKFLRKFEEVDVLILDDIQIIANKNACQDILLGLFNEFVDKKKQVIFSGDKPPRQLMQIEERLKTRFALGTICEITMPDFETRMAILKQKRNARGEELLETGYELVASTITDNVRELEGITNTLITKKQLMQRDLNLDDVIQVLKSMGYEYRGVIGKLDDDVVSTDQKNKKRSKDDEFMQTIQKIADYYGLSSEEMLASGRKQELVLARSIAMRVAKKSFGWTLDKIGKFFKKNHSSVIYALNQFEDNLKEDASLKDDLRALGIAM